MKAFELFKASVVVIAAGYAATLEAVSVERVFRTERHSRSDCHGWGSHPLWHLHTGVAGVRSASAFYGKVIVEPQPAHLKSIRSSTPTPKGNVELDLAFRGDEVSGTVTLPDGLSGEFRWQGKSQALKSGRNTLKFDD